MYDARVQVGDPESHRWVERILRGGHPPRSRPSRDDVRLLKKDLASKGIRVIGPEDASDEVGSWPQACGDVIASADAAAFVMSGELRGFAEVEVQQAAKHHKPIIPIVVGTARPSKCLDKIAGVHLDPFDVTAGSSDMLAALVKGAIGPRKSR